MKKEGSLPKETPKTSPTPQGTPTAASILNRQLQTNNTTLSPSTAFNLTGVPKLSSGEAANSKLAIGSEATVTKATVGEERVYGSVGNSVPLGNSEFSVSSNNSIPAPQAYFSNSSSSGGNTTANPSSLPLLAAGNLNLGKSGGETPRFSPNLSPTLSAGIGSSTGSSPSSSNTNSGAGGGNGTPFIPTALPNILPPQGLPSPFPIHPPLPIPGLGIGSGVTASGDSKSSGSGSTGSTTGSSTTTGGTTTSGGSSTGGASGTTGGSSGGSGGSPAPTGGAAGGSSSGGSGAGSPAIPAPPSLGIAILAANQPASGSVETLAGPSTQPTQDGQAETGYFILIKVPNPVDNRISTLNKYSNEKKCYPSDGNESSIFPGDNRPQVRIEHLVTNPVSKKDEYKALSWKFPDGSIRDTESTDECGLINPENYMTDENGNCKAPMRFTATFSTPPSGNTPRKWYRSQMELTCKDIIVPQIPVGPLAGVPLTGDPLKEPDFIAGTWLISVSLNLTEYQPTLQAILPPLGASLLNIESFVPK